MTNYSFKNDGKTYGQRAKQSFITNLIISFVIGLLVAMFNDMRWGIGIGLFFFIVQYFKSDRWDKTFINNISFDQATTNIEYLNRDKTENLIGATAGFRIKKEIALNKIKTPYLAIYQNNELKIKQFAIGEWTEIKMDELESAFSSKQTN
jgi:hypothetical protein